MIFEQIRMSILILLLHAYLVSAAASMTITASPDFSTQRPCLKYCLKGSWDIGWYIGCDSPLVDSCFCREDLQSSAIYYISSCVTSACESNTVDVSIGVSLYSSYCSMTALPTPVKPTSSSSRKASTAGSGPTNTGSTSSGGSGGSSGAGSSSGSGDNTNVNTNNINIGGGARSFWGGSLYVTLTDLPTRFELISTKRSNHSGSGCCPLCSIDLLVIRLRWCVSCVRSTRVHALRLTMKMLV